MAPSNSLSLPAPIIDLGLSLISFREPPPMKDLVDPEITLAEPAEIDP